MRSNLVLAGAVFCLMGPEALAMARKQPEPAQVETGAVRFFVLECDHQFANCKPSERESRVVAEYFQPAPARRQRTAVSVPAFETAVVDGGANIPFTMNRRERGWRVPLANLKDLRFFYGTERGEVELPLALGARTTGGRFDFTNPGSNTQVAVLFHQVVPGVEEAIVKFYNNWAGELLISHYVPFFDELQPAESAEVMSLIHQLHGQDESYNAVPTTKTKEQLMIEIVSILNWIRDPGAQSRMVAKAVVQVMSRSPVGGSCGNCADTLALQRQLLAPLFELPKYASIEDYLDRGAEFERIARGMRGWDIGNVRRLFASQGVLDRIAADGGSTADVATKSAKLLAHFKVFVETSYGTNYEDPNDHESLQRFARLAARYLGAIAPSEANHRAVKAMADEVRRVVDIALGYKLYYDPADAHAAYGILGSIVEAAKPVEAEAPAVSEAGN